MTVKRNHKKKQFIVEMMVKQKWKFYSDHSTRMFAESNAETIFDSRKIPVRIKDNENKGKVIFGVADILKIKEDKKKK